MEKIIENKVECLNCGQIIRSLHRHDYVRCRCGNVSVDGGTSYLKRSFRTSLWIDRSVVENYEVETIN